MGLKKIPHTVEFAGPVTARNVRKTSIGLEIFSLYLERAVAEWSTLKHNIRHKQMGCAAERRDPWTVQDQLLCRAPFFRLHHVHSLMRVSILFLFRIAAMNSERLRNPPIVIPGIFLANCFVRAGSRGSARKPTFHSREAPADNSKVCRETFRHVSP